MKHQRQHTRADRVGQVRVTFTAKPLTAWGELCAVMAKFLERIGFREWVERHWPVEERSPNAKGVYEKVLAILLTSWTGGTRFSHVGWWGHGLDAVKACFGVTWLPQTASVLTRFVAKFRQVDTEALRAAAAEFVGRLIESEQLKEDTLILDSTVCERYGKQEGARRGYNPRKPGRPSHHPLKAGLGSGYVVNLWNRRGDTHTAHQACAFYDQTRRWLRKSLVVSWVLADSGFGQEEFLAHLEGQGQRYIVALRMTSGVQGAILGIGEWKEIAPGIQIGEARCQLSSWTRKRRVIVVRQHVPTRPEARGKQPMLFKELEEYGEYRYHAMVTNEEGASALEVWRTYRPRANEENCIKELKHGYGWDEFNVKSFWGTEGVMLLLGMIGYNLVHYLNRCVLKTEQEKLVRLKTLRLRVWAIPGLYGSGGRRWILRLGVAHRRMRAKIRYWLGRIQALTLSLANCNAVVVPGTG